MAPLNFLHSELVVREGQVIQVTLSGNAANVLLLTDYNFEKYRRKEDFTAAAGGYYRETPIILHPPYPGHWHLIIDLAGEAGEVQASVTLRPERSD
jgi:hypothetical protein